MLEYPWESERTAENCKTRSFIIWFISTLMVKTLNRLRYLCFSFRSVTNGRFTPRTKFIFWMTHPTSLKSAIKYYTQTSQNQITLCLHVRLRLKP
jgi:hypothetical protein